MGIDIRAIQWFRDWNALNSTKGRQSLRELQASIPGCNYIFFDAMDVSQAGDHHSIICNASTNTATVNTAQMSADFEGAIAYAHSLGYKVLVRMRGPDWTIFSNPVLFLQNYATAVKQWAVWLEARHVEVFGIAAEAEYIEYNAYTPQWQNIIAQVRSVYSGQIYYDANYWWCITDQYAANGSNSIGETAHLAETWLNDLDFLSISAYPALTNKTTHPASPNAPTIDELVAGWHSWQIPTDMHNADIPAHWELYGNQFSKNILYHCGLSSFWGATNEPWASRASLQCLNEQNNWIEALFRVFNTRARTKGYAFDGTWCSEPKADIAASTGTYWEGFNNWAFMVQGKPAEAVIANYFGAASPLRKWGFKHWQDGDLNLTKTVIL